MLDVDFITDYYDYIRLTTYSVLTPCFCPSCLQGRNTQAHCPRFPKPKDEGWILVLGEVDSREVIAVKRVGYRRGRSTVQLAFYTPETEGRIIYTLYMMSDCYLGLDQQYDVCLQVAQSSLQAQVNSELLDLDMSR